LLDGILRFGVFAETATTEFSSRFGVLLIVRLLLYSQLFCAHRDLLRIGDCIAEKHNIKMHHGSVERNRTLVSMFLFTDPKVLAIPTSNCRGDAPCGVIRSKEGEE